MTQETFATLGVVFSGLLVIALVAIGVGALVASLKEWLYEKRADAKSTMSLLENQRALMEAHHRLNEHVKALEEHVGLRGEGEGE